MVSFKERLRKARAEIAQLDADPLRRLVETAVCGQDAIGSAALLDLLGLPTTTGNGRRLARPCGRSASCGSNHAVSCRVATGTP